MASFVMVMVPVEVVAAVVAAVLSKKFVVLFFTLLFFLRRMLLASFWVEHIFPTVFPVFSRGWKMLMISAALCYQPSPHLVLSVGCSKTLCVEK